MKLGAKKTKQAELLDALGGDALAPISPAPELSAPATPAAADPPAQPKGDGRGSLPEVEKERYFMCRFSMGRRYRLTIV